MDNIEITPADIEIARRAIDAWANGTPWDRIRIALEIEMPKMALPTIVGYKEWFPCCGENDISKRHTLDQLVHVISQEHIAWRYGLSPERFAKARKCLQVMQVLSDG